MDAVAQLRRPNEASALHKHPHQQQQQQPPQQVDSASLYGATSHPRFTWVPPATTPTPDERVPVGRAPPPSLALLNLAHTSMPMLVGGDDDGYSSLSSPCSGPASGPGTPQPLGDQHHYQYNHHHQNPYGSPCWSPVSVDSTPAASTPAFAAVNGSSTPIPRTPTLAGSEEDIIITTTTTPNSATISTANTSACCSPLTPGPSPTVASFYAAAAAAATSSATANGPGRRVGAAIKPSAPAARATDIAYSTPASPAPSSSSQTLSPRLGRPRSKLKAAMPGRPSKRSAVGDDDGSPSANSTRLKLPRTDGALDGFSTVVKNRFQSHTRTGQACDRCKVRKIRCDASPEGCSNCATLNINCFVTDRVTGRTERRGYMQELEREKSEMLAHVRDLEKLLHDKGLKVKPWPGVTASQYPHDVSDDESGNPVPDDLSSNDNWTQVGSLWVKQTSGRPLASTINLPRNQWESRPEQNHLGVGPDNAPLSSIRGTRLSLLGTSIDTTSFDAPDMDEPAPDAPVSAPLYNKSVQAFLQSCMGVNPPVPVDFPSREEAFTYAEWYFRAISVFTPLLHKPSFMHLLTRIYEEPNFGPSIPDLVSVHMVLSTMYFHCGVRNAQQVDQRNNLNELSNKHYHFALSKIYDLFSSQELAAVQALALIALHTRAFPKPGCGSIVASMALHRALELNLHRSSRKPGEGTDLNNELRKRIWWVILTVVVAVNGKRGCPLPVNVQDFDTEFPEPIADELLSERGVDMSQSLPCPYQAGLAGFKIIPLFMEMYANIYSVRRDAQNYVNVVKALEAQLKQWEAELPDSLRLGQSGNLDNASTSAIYTKIFALELRLCLRHPSAAMTTNRTMMADNTRICEETAREFLICMKQLSKMRALDTTWYQMSVYGVCIFSMLVAHWERRYETTPEQVAVLREDMQFWMSIVKETSVLLACGPGISNQLGQIIERTIGWIEHDMQRKDAKKPSGIKQEEQLAAGPPFSASQVSEGVPNVAGAPRGEGHAKGYYQESGMSGQQCTGGMSYGDQSQGNANPGPYHSDPSMFYGPPPTASVVPNNSGQPGSMAAFGSQPPQHINAQASTDMMWHTGSGNTWNDWTAAIADTQDRYSANALLALGNTGRPSVMGDGSVGQAGGDINMVPPGAQWPLVMFDHPTHGGP